MSEKKVHHFYLDDKDQIIAYGSHRNEFGETIYTNHIITFQELKSIQHSLDKVWVQLYKRSINKNI